MNMNMNGIIYGRGFIWTEYVLN